MCFRCLRTWTCCNGYFEAICEELTAMLACVLIISLPFQHIFPIHDPLIISRRIATRKDATTSVKKQQALLYSLYFFSFSFFLPLSHSFLHFLPLSLTAASNEVIYYTYFFKGSTHHEASLYLFWLCAMKDIYSVHYTVTYITLTKACIWSFQTLFLLWIFIK